MTPHHRARREAIQVDAHGGKPVRTIGKKMTHSVPALLLDPTGSVGGSFVNQFESAWAAGRANSAAPADVSP